MPDANRYAWVDDALQEAACVTVLAGATRADVLRAFGADTSTARTVEDAYGGDEDGRFYVAVGEVPGGAVAVEQNGYLGTLQEVLVRLSRLGPTASIFWNVNDDNAFSCARDGEVIAVVDMYDAEDPDEVDLPPDLMDLFVLAADALVAEDDEGEANGEPVGMWAVGLAMAEKFTGVAIPEQTVRNIGPFHPAPLP